MLNSERSLMLKEFLEYYNDELAYLRRLGKKFAEEHGDVASELGMARDGRDKATDTHVERLMEAFAFLAARIHLRLDDDFPQISGALLDVLYPQFCRPIPSLTMVQFLVGEGVTEGQTIKAGTPITTIQKPGAGRCQFRTCYDTKIYPLTITQASWSLPSADAASFAAVLQIELRCLKDVKLRNLKVDSLRFYLGSDQIAYRLYELIHGQCQTIVIRDPGRPDEPAITLPRQAIASVGFEQKQSLWPCSAQTFRGYEILQEFFAFPAKFLYFELLGSEFTAALAGLGERAQIEFRIRRIDNADWKKSLERDVQASTFRLGCTPAVNLFPATPDKAIQLSHTVYEHPVIVNEKTEIYSVESVAARGRNPGSEIPLERFYGLSAFSQDRKINDYWYAMRRPPMSARKPAEVEKIEKASGRRRDAFGKSEVVLVIVDDRKSTLEPGAVLTVRLLCTNGNDPSHMSFPLGGDSKKTSHFQAEIAGVYRVLCVLPPTKSFSPPSDDNPLWQLITHLSLNHRSLVDDGPGPLKSLLAMHNLTHSQNAAQAVDGISGLTGVPDFARVDSEQGAVFVRGRRIEIELDEELHFQDNGVYLFGAVLERFFGAWTSLNSFTQLHVRTRRRDVAEFAPRAGNRVVA